MLAFVLLRAVTASVLPLTGDEAYYWEYAHHLALGYHDHPPMVGWIVALSCAILGPSTLAVRLPFVVLGGVAALLVHRTTLRVSGSPTAAAWAGTFLLITPLFTLAGMATFPDGPLLFFTAVFLFVAWQVFVDPRPTRWMALGAAAGLAASSKLTGLYLLPSFFCFLLVTDLRRRSTRPALLRGAGPWMALGMAVLMLGPFLWWNATHGWDSFAYQYGSRLGSSHGVQTRYLVAYLALSTAVFSPILWAMAIWATLVAGWRGLREAEDGQLFLFCMAVPIHAFFLACSLLTKIGLHWAAPGTLAACMALGTWLADRDRLDRRSVRAWTACGVALSVGLSAIIYLAALSPATLMSAVSGGIQLSGVNKGQPLSGTHLAELMGIPEAARHVAQVATEMRSRGGRPFIFTTNYTLSSALEFYSGEPVHVVMGTRIGAEFDRWDDFGSLIGRDGLYVDTSPVPSREDVWSRLQAAFESLSLDAPFITTTPGVGSAPFHLVRCSRFSRDVFTPLKTSVRARQEH